MKNILLIATGGTIASKDNGNGLTPSIDVNVLLDYIPVIRQKCHVTGISLMNIDSSNMDTSHISSISECIMNNYNDYDGFVITHGTDTCAYTAAALSYQLINLSKPVILTGSQLPIDVEKTDAVMNLTFESINFPYIAAIRNNIVKYNINTIQNIMTSDNGFHIKTDMCTDIAVIRLFPGMNYNIFDYLNSSCRGVIIEGFGIGGMPDNITEHIHRLTVNGICVVVTTQCLYEGVNWEIYEVGRNLTKENVINGKSMTIENLTMKLMWSLAHYKNITDIKDFMEKEL